MNAFIPAWLKIVAPVALVALLCIGSAYLADRHADNQWKARWSARDVADAQAAQAFTEQQRRIELQRQGAIDAIQEQAQQDIATAQRNAAIAAVESDRLRNGITAAIARIQSGSGSATTTISSATRANTGSLLAELFREIDTAAGIYAAEADRARAAGLACERAYDAVRGQQ